MIFKYLRDFPEEIVFFEQGRKYKLGTLEFYTPFKNLHSVETYGVVFKVNALKIGVLSDTAYSEELVEAYKSDVLVVNIVFLNKRAEYQHLCVEEAEMLIQKMRPRLAVITHFGMTVLKAGPKSIAEEMTHNTGVNVVAAYDGMMLNLTNLKEKF